MKMISFLSRCGNRTTNDPCKALLAERARERARVRARVDLRRRLIIDFYNQGLDACAITRMLGDYLPRIIHDINILARSGILQRPAEDPAVLRLGITTNEGLERLKRARTPVPPESDRALLNILQAEKTRLRSLNLVRGRPISNICQ